MECRGDVGVRRKAEEGATMEAMIAAASAVRDIFLTIKLDAMAMAERRWGARIIRLDLFDHQIGI